MRAIAFKRRYNKKKLYIYNNNLINNHFYVL